MNETELVDLENSLKEINNLKQREDAIMGLVASSSFSEVNIKENTFLSKHFPDLNAFIKKVDLMGKIEKTEASMKAFIQLQNLPSQQKQLIVKGLAVLLLTLGSSTHLFAAELANDDTLGKANSVPW